MRNRNGFTLIELLVVITIIVVLAGLLIPGVLRAMKQAKTNRALSEMQHLATVITQIYSEVGYYVRLEDLVEPNQVNVKRWVVSLDTPPTANDYIDGQDDSTLIYGLSTPITTPATLDVSAMWNGPYLTYKSYYNIMLSNYTGSDLPIPSNAWDVNSTINTQLTNAPLDPWGRPYRMFWVTGPAFLIPAGAHGAMVIISAGGDGILQSLIGQEQRPTRSQQAAFNAFNPNDPSVTEKDVYYIFNAGIQ